MPGVSLADLLEVQYADDCEVVDETVATFVEVSNQSGELILESPLVMPLDVSEEPAGHLLLADGDAKHGNCSVGRTPSLGVVTQSTVHRVCRSVVLPEMVE